MQEYPPIVRTLSWERRISKDKLSKGNILKAKLWGYGHFMEHIPKLKLKGL